MKKISFKGRSWLKGLHLVFCGTWIGTGISMMLLGFIKGNTPNGDELFAINACIKLLDDFIIIPSAFCALITGVLLCWLTNWGFFKYNWIIVKLITTVAQMIFGTFGLGPWTNGAYAISDVERALALQNATYLHFRQMNNQWGTIQVILLIVVVFISVFKPWGKRGVMKKTGAAD